MAAALPMLLIGASTAMTIIGGQQQAKAQQAGMDYQAKQLEQQAGQTRATAQRQAMEDRRQATLAQSRVQALAGGGGTDESLLNFTGDIAAEGEYTALASLYEGEERALGLEGQATGLRMEGKSLRRAANWKSASTLLSGASSMYGMYGQGGPNMDSLQAKFSQTRLGRSGFGTGLAYGNQDMGKYF